MAFKDPNTKVEIKPQKKWIRLIPGNKMVYEKDGKFYGKNDKEVNA